MSDEIISVDHHLMNTHPPNVKLAHANLINDNNDQSANVEFPIEHSDDVIADQINTSCTVFSSTDSLCLFLSKLMASIYIAKFNSLQLFTLLRHLKLIVMIDLNVN